MAKFPKEVWNGLTRTRHDLDSTTPPDHEDWMALIGEIQEMQRYILNLSGSMEAMPNASESIREVDDKIQGLLAKLKRLAPPADLQTELVGLQRRVEEIDVRADHDRLRSGFNTTNRIASRSNNFKTCCSITVFTQKRSTSKNVNFGERLRTQKQWPILMLSSSQILGEGNG